MITVEKEKEAGKPLCQQMRDEYGSLLAGSIRRWTGEEILRYFLQVQKVGFTDRLDAEGEKKRGIKGDPYAFDLNNWVGVM